jgi:hypothetical protein
MMSHGAAATVVATIAGIAMAHAFTPPSGQSDTSSKLERQVVPEPSAIRSRHTPTSLEEKQLPVPIPQTHRPHNEHIASASSNALSQDDGAVFTSSFSSERTARAAIERDGYSGVSSLRRRTDGLWSGRAVRGSVEIEVTVDSAGKVTAN